MKSILVTGSNGQLGMTLQELAPDYSELKFHFTDRSTLDITNAGEVHQTFVDTKPHYCINCAAFTQVDQAEKTPDAAYEVNVKGVANLVQACKEFNTILIHLSTDYVFDGTNEQGYRPDDFPNPINVYGKTKLEGEKLIRSEMDQYFIIRTSWLYSREYGHNFYKTILAKAVAGENLMVTDKERGCPTDAVNLGKYLIEMIASGSTNYGIKHFSDEQPMTWYEFAIKIINENNITLKMPIQKKFATQYIAKRPANSILLG